MVYRHDRKVTRNWMWAIMFFSVFYLGLQQLIVWALTEIPTLAERWTA